MPLTWVLVRAPADQAPEQNVFVSTDIHHPVGMTGTPFQVEVGVHTFTLRGGNAVIADAMEECPEASETAPFKIDLIPTAIAVLNPPAPPRIKKTAKKSRKKAARKKTAAPKRPSAGKKAAPKRKAAAKPKTAPKRKAAGKGKTAAKRKTAAKKAAPKRKTAAKGKKAPVRKKAGARKKAAAKTRTKRPVRGRSRRSS